MAPTAKSLYKKAKNFAIAKINAGQNMAGKIRNAVSKVPGMINNAQTAVSNAINTAKTLKRQGLNTYNKFATGAANIDRKITKSIPIAIRKYNNTISDVNSGISSIQQAGQNVKQATKGYVKKIKNADKATLQLKPVTKAPLETQVAAPPMPNPVIDLNAAVPPSTSNNVVTDDS